MNIQSTLRLFVPPIVTKLVQSMRLNAVGPYKRDEFLSWLNFITPGMLSSSNLPLFNYSIRHMPESGAVVEIGSFAGLSLNHILHMMKQSGRSNPVLSVDEWHFEGASQGVIPGSSVTFAAYRDHVIETFKRNLMLFHADRLPYHVATSSDEFFSLWSKRAVVTDLFGRQTELGGEIAMAHVDGDHTHEQSRRDFENIDRFLCPGGFIVFDDSADYSGWGSRLTAAEAGARPDYEVVAKTPNYCVRKRA